MSEEIIRYVKAAAEGDTDAMARLFSATLKTSYYLAGKLTNDDAVAVEITKKAYARAFCTVTKLKKPEAFEIWMKQNVINVYKDYCTFTFEEAEGGAEEGQMEFLSESVIGDFQKTSAVLSSAALLDTEKKTAVILQYFCGMPVVSLSKYFGVSESTVNGLLAAAKEEIFAVSGSEEPVSTPVGTLPVLTRLFQSEMAEYPVDPADVRTIFGYAIEIYNSFRQAELQKEAAHGESGQYFTKKPEPAIPGKSSDTLSVPRSSEKSDPDKIDYDAFTDEPVKYTPPKKKGFDISSILSSVKKINIKGLDIKKIGIIAVAVIILICVIAGIVKSKHNKTPEVVSSDVSSDVGATPFEWVPGGFEDCVELEYLDSKAAVFKSATTGKYGLMDYQGNVIINPEYEEKFKRCENGRDYDNSGKYHSVAMIDGIPYQVIYSADGSASISTLAHESHGVDQAYPDKNSYDERDCYYEGYAAARKNGKWGYVSEANDKKVIPYEYEDVNVLSESEAKGCDYCRPVTGGLIAVKQNELMGIINLKNEIVVPFEYANIFPGRNGVFIAQKNGTWGVITVGSAVSTFAGVKLSYIEETPVENIDDSDAATYIVVCDTGINVRSGPGAEYEDIGDLASGEEIEGYGTTTAASGKDWLKVKYEGRDAYIPMSFVKRK